MPPPRFAEDFKKSRRFHTPAIAKSFLRRAGAAGRYRLHLNDRLPRRQTKRAALQLNDAAIDEAGLVAQQEGHGVGHVDRLAHPSAPEFFWATSA